MAQRWIKCLKPRPDARLRLFLFPYAGGGTASFRRWPEALSPSVELLAVQLPGREARYREPLLTSMPDAVARLADGIAAELDRPFMFFGHSLGALLSFELTRELRRRGLSTPLKLVASGRIAPHVPDPDKPIHQLPHAEFVDELIRLNGTPAEVLATPEVMELMVPVIRADFTIAETYVHTQEARLSCPISAYGGISDPHTPEALLTAWGEQTSGAFKVTFFEGDHFFVNSQFAKVMQTLNDELRAVLQR
jgi:medium-chain acyl-[acyl-carrier-protein] hydrolase